MSKGRVTVSLPQIKTTDKSLKTSESKSNNKKHKLEESSEENSSDSDSESESGLEDDEVDLDALTDSEDEANGSDAKSDSDSDSDSNLPKLKKRKKAKDADSDSFANAITAILGSKLKAYDRKEPILARSKQTIQKAENEKLEAKARRELLAEKKKVYDKDRIRDLLPKADEDARAILDYERRLKKTAQRGVIRLFNVLMSTQTKTNSEAASTKVNSHDQKEKLITELSKEKFFDLVKSAGK